MKAVSIHDAKTNLSKYIAAAKRGEEIYIGSHGKPEVRLIVETPKKPKRQLGVLKGQLSDKTLAYDKHQDPEWQQMIDDMYNKPLDPDEKNTA
ncbi:MAG TPA: type II toxin-antitoxin system prevent-host-death family antitoxin [Candidatus Limnocylindria bacterium]|nr:type II toxin-antitoxin system prevent-host-death family antitoxin [Candidatus Limnocylindria bacterium]